MEREREGRGDNIKAKEEEGREEKKRKEEEGWVYLLSLCIFCCDGRTT